MKSFGKKFKSLRIARLIEKMPVFFQTFQKSDQMINTIKQVINSAWR